MRFACLVQALLFLLVSGCGEPEPSDTPVVSEDPSGVGSGSYTNKFNSEAECKEYTGDTWTSDGAEEDWGAIQYYPHSASPPPELTAGKRYHLYVLYDVALPIARCVFEVSSDAPSKGCSAAGGRSVGAIAMGFVLLAVLGRRRRTG